MDGLGTQAGETPGTEPTFAWFDDHHICAWHSKVAREPVWCSLCHHARRRHTVAPRRRCSSCRNNGASSESTKVQRSRWACPRGLWHRATAHYPFVAHELPEFGRAKSFFGPGWHRSIFVGGVGCLPGL